MYAFTVKLPFPTVCYKKDSNRTLKKQKKDYCQPLFSTLRVKYDCIFIIRLNSLQLETIEHIMRLPHLPRSGVSGEYSRIQNNYKTN
jgi:hypothetical protein